MFSTFPTQNPHLYQRDVENIVNAILDEIIAAMARGDRVELRGFGAFSVKQRPARTGRNPRTGAHVSVDQKCVPFFKTGKEMRERLNRPSARLSRRPAIGRTASLRKIVAVDHPRAARHRHHRLCGGQPAGRHGLARSVQPGAPGGSVTLPLFALIIVLLILGVVIGGIAAWLRQGKWRRTARRLEREASELRGEIDCAPARRERPRRASPTPVEPPRAPAAASRRSAEEAIGPRARQSRRGDVERRPIKDTASPGNVACR